MTQRTFTTFDHCQECAANGCYNDCCQGDCGCDTCRDCFDDPIWRPIEVRCPECKEIVAVIYGPNEDGEHGVDYPTKGLPRDRCNNPVRPKCCEKERMRIWVEGVEKELKGNA